MDLQILYNNPTRMKSKITKENPSMKKYKKAKRAKRNPTQQVYKKMLATEQGRKDLESAAKAGSKMSKSYKQDDVYKIGRKNFYTPKEIEKIKNNYQDQKKRYQDAVKSGKPHADELLSQIRKSQMTLANVLKSQSEALTKESGVMLKKGYVPDNMFDAEGNAVISVRKAIKQNQVDRKKIAQMKKKQADDYKAFLKQVAKMKNQEKELKDPSKVFRKKRKKISKKAAKKAAKKTAKKAAKKVAKKIAKKPSYKKPTRKVAKKVAKKVSRKKASKKKASKKKASKRSTKRSGRKYNVRKNPVHEIEVMENVMSKKKTKKKASKKKASKKKASKRKGRKASKKKSSIASQLHKLGGSKKKKTGKKKSFKKKSYKLKGNPNKEQLMAKFQELTQHTVSEATGLLSGGALIKIYDHHIKQKFISPALSPFLSKLGASAPFVDSLIDVLAAALVGKGLSMIGEKTKMDGFDVVGKGLIGAAVVQLGIKSIASLSTAAGMPMSGIIAVPSMNGIIAVPQGMNGIIGVPQMGAFSADFQGMGAAGMTNADFGAYTTVGMDGGFGQSYMQDADYGSGSVIPTAPRNPESLGGYENVEYSDEGEEGDF